MKSITARLIFILIGVIAPAMVFSQNFQSSNLPIIVINTNGNAIVDDPKIEAEMGVIDNGTGVRNNLSDAFNNYNGKIGIEIRGSSSQMFPKKQYGIELLDENGDGIDASLLGLPKEEDWILFAPYNDKSLMRDVLAYKIARDMGSYAPRTKYCELVLNGQYQGVYVLIEKIKRDKNRVNINKLDKDENSGDDLTGGYIIKIDKTTGETDPGWISTYDPPSKKGNQKINFLYEEPDAEDMIAEQKQYIQNFMAEFEVALAGPDFKDNSIGYQKYIDVNSFVDYFIINEVSKNVDAYRLSTFMHKQRDSDGGKLVMGPVWDFNLGFGNADYCTKGSPEGLVIYFNTVCPDDFWLVPFWWNRLFADPAFQQKVTTRWTELRSDKLSLTTLHGYVDSVALVLSAESQQRNFQRWPVLGQYVWPNYFVGATFKSEVDWLKNWISERLAWMDENISIVTANEAGITKAGFYVEHSPNPFKENFKLQYAVPTAGDVSVEIIDATGRRVDNIKMHHETSGSYSLMIGSNLPSGLYFLTYSFNGLRLKSSRMIKH
jgi:hypothetical protein